MAEKVSFEKAMSRLEEIVRLLEKGDAPLEKSLSLFEEGTKIIKHCSHILDNAEQKVLLLLKTENDAPVFTEFYQEEQDGI